MTRLHVCGAKNYYQFSELLARADPHASSNITPNGKTVKLALPSIVIIMVVIGHRPHRQRIKNSSKVTGGGGGVNYSSSRLADGVCGNLTKCLKALIVR
jgi:hypothetical protein